MNNTFFVAYVLTASLVGVSAATLYVPSFGLIALDLGVSPDLIQVSLSAFFGSFAVFHLVLGPLSDRYGRSPVVILGLAVFVAASAVTVFAGSIEVLIASRILQGVGAAACAVVPRAAVRDVFDRDGSARIMAYIAMVGGLGAALSPMVGLLLQSTFGTWRMSFAFLAGIGAVTLWLAWMAARRTPATERAAAQTSMISSYFVLMRRGPFVISTGMGALTRAGFFAFIAVSPFLALQIGADVRGALGFLLVSISGGFLAGNFVAARLVRRVRLEHLAAVGTIIAVAGSIAVILVAVVGDNNFAALIGCAIVFNLGGGLAIPPLNAIAVSVDTTRSGAAASLYGFGNFGGSSIASALVILLSFDTVAPTGVFLFGLALAAMLLSTALLRSPKEALPTSA